LNNATSKLTGNQSDMNPLQSNHEDNNVMGHKDHHHKRDATLVSGAAGLAGHELNNQHNNQSGLGEDYHEGVKSNIQSGIGNNHHTGVNNNPLHSGSDNINRASNDNDHHYKRDAALGAGAAGIAGHEMKNHHDKQSGLNDNYHNNSNPLQSGLNSNHEGVHNNPLHSGSDNINRASNDNDHHYKRDAALGAGAAGIAGHELKNHHDKESHSNRTSISSKSSIDGTGEKKGAAVHDKPLNTGGDAHHIAEQPPLGLGGLTGKQPVGEVNFHKLS
jgi:hypothetical protein